MDGGRYSKIFRRMWNDSKFRRLSRPQPCGQSLWMRFLCGPELGPVPGLFSAREEGLASSMGWDLKPFRESFRELLGNGLADADWDAGLVWVPNAIRYNEPANPNVVKSWSDAWAELPECELKSKAFTALCAYLETRGEQFVSTFRNHCPNHSPNHCPNQEQEQEHDQEQDPPIAPQGAGLLSPCEPKAKRKRAPTAEGSDAFEAFWQAFPAHRRVNKPEAIKAWPGDEHAPAIMAHVEAVKRKDGGEFIKQCDRYLRKEMWKVPVFEKQLQTRDVSHGHYRATTEQPKVTGEVKL